MSEYRSIHSGANIDTAVSNVLNGTAGIQGVSVFGNELQKDASNKVNILWNNLTTEGTWIPSVIAKNGNRNDVSSNTEYEYRWGYYIKFGGLCYITFRLKGRITSLDTSQTSYFYVGGLPFTARNLGGPSTSQEFSLTISELSVGDRALDFGFQITNDGYQEGMTTCKINSDNNYIDFERKNGVNSLPMSATNNEWFWISVSGFYPV